MGCMQGSAYFNLQRMWLSLSLVMEYQWANPASSSHNYWLSGGMASEMHIHFHCPLAAEVGNIRELYLLRRPVDPRRSRTWGGPDLYSQSTTRLSDLPVSKLAACSQQCSNPTEWIFHHPAPLLYCSLSRRRRSAALLGTKHTTRGGTKSHYFSLVVTECVATRISHIFFTILNASPFLFR